MLPNNPQWWQYRWLCWSIEH